MDSSHNKYVACNRDVPEIYPQENGGKWGICLKRGHGFSNSPIP